MPRSVPCRVPGCWFSLYEPRFVYSVFSCGVVDPLGSYNHFSPSCAGFPEFCHSQSSNISLVVGLNLFTSVAGQRLFDANWSRYQSGYKRWPVQAIYRLLLGLLHVVSLVESYEIHCARFLPDPEIFPISCGLFQYSFPFPNLIAHVFHPYLQNFFYCPSQGGLGASPAMNPPCYLVSLHMWVVALSSGIFY